MGGILFGNSCVWSLQCVVLSDSIRGSDSPVVESPEIRERLVKIEGLNSEQVDHLLSLVQRQIAQWADATRDPQIRASVWGEYADRQHAELVGLYAALIGGLVEA